MWPDFPSCQRRDENQRFNSLGIGGDVVMITALGHWRLAFIFLQLRVSPVMAS